MIIEIKELCLVDYIKEDDVDNDENQEAIRTVQYESDKDNFMDALNDYEESFDIDKILYCNDEFQGGCLDTIDILSVTVVEK